MKAFLRSDFGQRAVAWAAAAWIRLVFRTTRWTIVDESHVSRLVATGRPFIVCFWHARMIPWPMFLRRHGFPVSMLISPHGDGRIIALAIAKLGVPTIEGSTFRDPMKALVDYAKPLASAKYVVMETFKNDAIAPGQKQFWYPWPYIEGLTPSEKVMRK